MESLSPQQTPLQVAVTAAKAAGRELRRGYGRARQVSHKGLVDLVTEWDRRSEDTILGMIRDAFPTHAVLAEESGASQQTSDHRWIVDPLDGTTNFAHAYPMFCVSIAYERHGDLHVGVVLDPLRRELFAAERGQGATLNGRPIHVSAATTLIDSLLETGFPYDRSRMATALAQLDHMAFQSQGIRRSGAAALALAYVAAGRLDGFWEARLNPWDHAAGALLIQEAGGCTSLLDGSPYQVDCHELAASNGQIQDELIAELGKVAGSAVGKRGI
jgi:myo-inositol-1(or 4)-monophosphatase